MKPIEMIETDSKALAAFGRNEENGKTRVRFAPNKKGLVDSWEYPFSYEEHQQLVNAHQARMDGDTEASVGKVFIALKRRYAGLDVKVDSAPATAASEVAHG